jgi:putative oxidoreductase
MLKSLGKYRDYAPLIIRLMLGTTLLFAHGLPKLMAPNRWEREGAAMATFGITFAPVFWGFMAGFTEVLAGILFWIGLAVRPAAVLMMWVMFVAMSRNIATGRLGGSDMHPLDFSAGLVALLILGAGVYSLDRKLGWDKPVEETKGSASRRAAV